MALRLFGSSRILDIWPSLSQSPILTQFGWSPLIRSAFNANMKLFQPSSASASSWLSLERLFPALIPVHPTEASTLAKLAAPNALSDPAADEAPTTPSLLVLHIRRGDFEGHCQHLATWNSDFNGFNKFPGLPDAFAPFTEGVSWGETSDENRAEYTRRCFPDVPQIVKRVMEVKREWELAARLASGGSGGKAGRGQDGLLKSVYVMTNGRTEWLGELKAALMAAYKWDGVASSRDLVLNWEQKYVAQTVDMMIGQRAGVFIGNGVRFFLYLLFGIRPDTVCCSSRV